MGRKARTYVSFGRNYTITNIADRKIPNKKAFRRKAGLHTKKFTPTGVKNGLIVSPNKRRSKVRSTHYPTSPTIRGIASSNNLAARNRIIYKTWEGPIEPKGNENIYDNNWMKHMQKYNDRYSGKNGIPTGHRS